MSTDQPTTTSMGIAGGTSSGGDDNNYTMLPTESSGGGDLISSSSGHHFKFAYCIICVILGVLIGLGIFAIVTYTQSVNWKTAPEVMCPSFPKNITYYEARQDLFSFHATYNFLPFFNGKIQFVCASYNLDVKLLMDDQFAARTNRKIMSTISESEILDCHGDVIFVTRTGDAWDAIINQMKVSISLEVHAPDGDVIAYVQGTHFFDDDISLVDLDGETVAVLHRSFMSFPPLWSFTVYQPDHSASDPRLLGVLAGMRHWIGKNPDSCNRTFWGVIWTWLVIGIIIALACLILIVRCIRNSLAENKSMGVI